MKENFLVTREFQLINEDSMLKLEYHYFAALSEIIHLGNAYLWLLNYQVKKKKITFEPTYQL